MKIRAITVFVPGTSWEEMRPRVRLAAAAASSLRIEFEALGYEVQTTRLATNSFERYLLSDGDGDGERGEASSTRDMKTKSDIPLKKAAELIALLDELGVEFFNLGAKNA